MQSSLLKIINARLILPGGQVEKGCLLAVDGRIESITPDEQDVAGSVIIDAENNYVSAGWIDLHVHGGGGHDFMDNTVEAFLGVAETHARFGTTALCPTTLSSEQADLLQTLRLYDAADRLNHTGARFIGMHIEGPYFAMNQRGAQDPRYIRDPDPAEYRSMIEQFPCVRRWSIAPELPGALEMGDYLTEKGVVAAIAHTDAVYDDVAAALKHGYTLGTHFYSGMSGVARRDCFRYAGVIESCYLLDELAVEVIADGVHLPAPLLQLIYKVKGTPRIALVTDAMRAAGMPPGPSILGGKTNGLPVIVEDGVAKLPDRSSFAGSVATADRLIRNMVDLADVPLTEAVHMMTETPAQVMGMAHQLGKLKPGYAADLVIFDQAVKVKKTIVSGRVIYQA